MTTTKLTAADFTDPLIRVLGEMTGFQAGVPVDMKDTFRPIMDLMGIDSIEAHGFQEPKTKKRPYVSRWITWAYRQARVPSDDGGPGLTLLGGRGQWGLTPEGAQKARELSGATETQTMTPVAEALAEAIIDADVELELDLAVRLISAFNSFGELIEATKGDKYTPTLTASQGISQDSYNAIVLIREALTSRGIPVFPEVLRPFVETVIDKDGTYLGDGVQLPIPEELSYHHDPYIVSLASEQTQCFGSFSPRSNVCGRCPLQGACLNVVRGKLAELAKGFTHRLQMGDVAEVEEDTDAILAAAFADDDKPKERDPEWEVVNKSASQIKAGADGKCYRCGGGIRKGSKAWWSRTPNTGLYHEECF